MTEPIEHGTNNEWTYTCPYCGTVLRNGSGVCCDGQWACIVGAAEVLNKKSFRTIWRWSCSDSDNGEAN